MGLGSQITETQKDKKLEMTWKLGLDVEYTG